MTWHTSKGDRYLTGNESRVFRAALRETIEQLELKMLDCSGTVLAGESRKSLLHLFAYVGHYLLRDTPDLAPLNAWTEAAVAICFRQLIGAIECEIDFSDPDETEFHAWRELVWNAIGPKARKVVADTIVDVNCVDADAWRFLANHLQDRVLWDTDWEMDFEWAPNEVMNTLGIAEGYYNWRLVTQRTNQVAIRQLGDLCGFRRGESEGIDV